MALTYKIESLIVIILTIAFIAVPAIPFLNKDKVPIFNPLLAPIGVISELVCIVILFIELNFHTRIIQYFSPPKREQETPRSILVDSENEENISILAQEHPIPLIIEHKYLAYLFFLGFAIKHAWLMLNETYFLFLQKDNCTPSSLNIVYLITKLTMSSILLCAMIIKNDTKKSVSETTDKKWRRVFGWAFLFGVCFSNGFKIILEDVIYSYSLFIYKVEEGAIPNVSPEDYTDDLLYPISRHLINCSFYNVDEGINDVLMEFLPFATEFFSLGAIFCLFKWKNSLSSKKAVVVEEEEVVLISTSNQNQLVSFYHTCTNSCLFSINIKLTVFIVSIFGTLTLALIILFFYLLAHKMSKIGILLSFFQQSANQLIIFTLELIFYYTHLRYMELNEKGKNFDLVLAILPILPLTIFYVLIIIPSFYDFDINYFTSSIISYGTIVLRWMQISFQAFFLTKIMSVKDEVSSLKSVKYFILTLSFLNAALWLLWSLEVRSIVFNGIYYRIYGIERYLFIVYSTLPFVLFSYAHAASVFYEIFIKLKHG